MASRHCPECGNYYRDRETCPDCACPLQSITKQVVTLVIGLLIGLVVLALLIVPQVLSRSN